MNNNLQREIRIRVIHKNQMLTFLFFAIIPNDLAINIIN